MAKVRRPSVQVNVATNGKADVNVTVNVSKHDRRPLRFGSGNAKLSPAIPHLQPAGRSRTCPHAKDCKSESRPHLRHHPRRLAARFRCYAASMEARHGSVRRFPVALVRQPSRLRLETRDDTPHLGLAHDIRWVRFEIHDSGDFFSQDYFDSWLEVARQRPRTHFYAPRQSTSVLNSSGWTRSGPATSQAKSRTWC